VGIAEDRVSGYEILAPSHFAAAYAVASKNADCCIASQSAARYFGLDFIPIAAERFDLTFSQEACELPAAQAALNALNGSLLRRKLESVAGYDSSHSGEVVV
jgi:putative molybdopterin biosynthesis protein